MVDAASKFRLVTRSDFDGLVCAVLLKHLDLIDDIKATLSGMMSAVIHEENTGQAEVRDTFVVPKVGTVAGCIVSDGKVIKGGFTGNKS